MSSDEAEYALIEQYLHNSRGETHDYQFEVPVRSINLDMSWLIFASQVVDIFRIMRAEEKDRQLDDMCVDDSRSNRRLLWHGSRCANFGGILSNGLQIAPPGAERSGKMFDDGIYLADASSKSAVYCHAYQTDDIGLLLLCEAELGNMNKLYKRDNSAATAIKNGYDSVWGHGKIGPVDWIDAGLIHDGLNGVKMVSIAAEVHNASLTWSSLISVIPMSGSKMTMTGISITMSTLFITPPRFAFGTCCASICPKRMTTDQISPLKI